MFFCNSIYITYLTIYIYIYGEVGYLNLFYHPRRSTWKSYRRTSKVFSKWVSITNKKAIIIIIIIIILVELTGS
jgi:hypothetical protein